MDTHATTDELVQQQLNPERLASWLDRQGLPGQGSPLAIEVISGGNQNIVAGLKRADLDVVLRRPPRVIPAGREAAMGREFRVLTALEGTDVPHARPVAFCTDESVLGTTFYLMERIDGWSPAASYRWPGVFGSDESARRGLAIELISGLAKVACVDWRAQGLEGFGKPEGFHDRQVDRWLAHWAQFRFRDIPGLDQAAAWLRTHRPAEWTPGIMHGDFAFLNVMFRHGDQPRLAAIVDWEMATIGDPFLDVAWLLGHWPATDDDELLTEYVDYSGMPLRDEMLAVYEEQCGRPLRNFVYYQILASFKSAIILEGGYARFLKGETDNPKLEKYNDSILMAAQTAAELVRSAD